jgi:hypothetical protein
MIAIDVFAVNAMIVIVYFGISASLVYAGRYLW